MTQVLFRISEKKFGRWSLCKTIHFNHRRLCLHCLLMFLTQLRRSGSGKNVVTPLPLVKRKEVETEKEISKQLNKKTGKENGTQEGFTQFRTPSSVSKKVPLQVQFACGHFKRHIFAFELLLFRQTSQAPRPAAASALCCLLRSYSRPKRQIWQARLSFKRFFMIPFKLHPDRAFRY